MPSLIKKSLTVSNINATPQKITPHSALRFPVRKVRLKERLQARHPLFV